MGLAYNTALIGNTLNPSPQMLLESEYNEANHGFNSKNMLSGLKLINSN